jgi:hypothetical protein
VTAWADRFTEPLLIKMFVVCLIAAKLRFWLAFAAGAIFGAVWSYRIVKDLEL